MRGQLFRLRAISVAVILLATTSGASSHETKDGGLPKFHRINEKLYRGAQPLNGGIEKLRALKIKTVINLRSEDEESTSEELEARAAGLKYFSVPLPGYGRPRDEQVEQVLALINDPQNWPVFVHCRHGEDRTGTIIAVYRITQDGWSSEEAKKEAKRHGMSRFQFAMKDYISDYARDHKLGLQRAARQ